MKQLVFGVLLFAGFCHAQDAGRFVASSTNVYGAEYPRVDNSGRVQLRVKAPDAAKVQADFWGRPKLDLTRQADGYWTGTTEALVP